LQTQRKAPRVLVRNAGQVNVGQQQLNVSGRRGWTRPVASASGRHEQRRRTRATPCSAGSRRRWSVQGRRETRLAAESPRL